jgi:RHS repeat-associated protein
MNLLGSAGTTAYVQATVNHSIGKRSYELTNHLGSVITVVSDKVIPHSNGSTVDYCQADILQSTDYSPFGVQLNNRTLSKSGVTDFVRFGYQGSEIDKEVKNGGNSYTTFFRQLDPRLGRWLSLDPKAVSFPAFSPYISMGNNPVCFNDTRGDSVPTKFYDETGNKLDVVPDRVQEMYNNEYGISVGYNAKTGMMFKTGEVTPCGPISSSAKSEWDNLLGTETNNSKKLVFGYGLKLVDGVTGNNSSTVLGVWVPDAKTGYVDMADFDNDGGAIGAKVTYEKGYSGGSPEKSISMARVLEHEYLGHGIHNLTDDHDPFKNDYNGPTVELTNSYQSEMNIMERIM